MKKKKFLPLLAILTAGSILLLSGCNVDVTTINEGDVPIEVAVEEQNLSDGMAMLHTVWYDEAGGSLSSVDVAFYDGETLIFSGTTNDAGSLSTCALPCNTELYCSVTDMSGFPLAESDIIIKLSENYSELTVYPAETAAVEEELVSCVIEVPVDRTNIRAAVFVTNESTINFANLTPYVEPEAEVEDPAEAAAEAEETSIPLDDDAAAAEAAVETEEAVEAEEAVENAEASVEESYEGETESSEGGEEYYEEEAEYSEGE